MVAPIQKTNAGVTVDQRPAVQRPGAGSTREKANASASGTEVVEADHHSAPLIPQVPGWSAVSVLMAEGVGADSPHRRCTSQERENSLRRLDHARRRHVEGAQR